MDCWVASYIITTLQGLKYFRCLNKNFGMSGTYMNVLKVFDTI